MGVNIFQNCICQKVNIKVQVEFKLAYYEGTVRPFRHGHLASLLQRLYINCLNLQETLLGYKHTYTCMNTRTHTHIHIGREGEIKWLWENHESVC